MSLRKQQQNQEIHLAKELEKALPLSRKQVPKELLLPPKPSILIKHACIDWIWIVLFWLGMWGFPNWMYPFFALMVAGRIHSLGVVHHDLAHMPLKKKTNLVRVLEVLSGYPIGTTVNAMRYHHLRHHKDNGMDTDPYFNKYLKNNYLVIFLYLLKFPLIIIFWIARSAYGSLAYYLDSLRNSYGRIFLQDRTGRDLRRNMELIQCASEERWLFLFHMFISGGICFFFPTFWVYGYLIPLFITGFLVGCRFLFEHTYDSAEDRSLASILHTTQDHHFNGLGALLFAPRNIGYHIVHHIHPQVAWYHLPELRKWYLEYYPQGYPKHQYLDVFGRIRRWYQSFYSSYELSDEST